MEHINIDNKNQFNESIHKLATEQSKNILASKLLEFKERITNSEISSIMNSAYELSNLMRESLFYKLETFHQNIPTIREITETFLNSFEILKMNQEIIEEYLSILEKIFYIFIFHFNIEIVDLSLKVLIFLLNEIDFEFHKKTLQKIIKIIHLLKLKKTVNPTVCNKIISNLSLALNLILHNTNPETKKCFYDFVSSNSEDFILIWILCHNCTNEMNFSKFYQVESISILIEKYIKELEKSTKFIETALQNFKSDQSLTMKNKIKQIFDIFGMSSKIIDAFNIRGNRSYNFDKIIKTNLIPVMKRFWNLILFVHESQIYEIDFAVESIQSIIMLCDSIDCMKFDILLPLLNWFGMLLEKNTKYIVNLFLIVKLMSKTSLPEETSTEIAGAIFEILEKIFSNVNTTMNKDKDAIFKYYIVMILDSLEKFPNYSINIKEDLKNCKEFYTSIKEGKFVDDKISIMTKKNFDIFTKEYKEVALSSINFERNPISANNNDEKLNKFSQLQNSLNKYEEFKTSLKTLYNLNNRNLSIDNKINNFIEKETKGERRDLSNIDTYENFYLETSIEMFREIFRYQK